IQLSTLLILFLYQRYHDHQKLNYFPTRRSSDLKREERKSLSSLLPRKNTAYQCLFTANILFFLPAKRDFPESRNNLKKCAELVRSEEHTSELQSRFDLVCRLLLEKKKRTT